MGGREEGKKKVFLTILYSSLGSHTGWRDKVHFRVMQLQETLFFFGMPIENNPFMNEICGREGKKN